MFCQAKTDLPVSVLIACLFLLAVDGPLLSAEDSPVTRFKSDWYQAMRIRCDPALQKPETADRQKQQIWALMDTAFDGELIAPRILQDTWPELTSEEKARLHPVMARVIKWKLIGKLYKYNVREIQFLGEGIDSGQYLLDAVLGTGPLKHPARFVFIRKRDHWVAVDIQIRGASLAAHYRRKFDGTFSRQGLVGLLAQLQQEADEEFDEMGYRP